MKLTDTGLTVQDIKDKVNTYMIETYERMDFLCETARDQYMYDEKGEKYLDFYAGIAVNSAGNCNEKVVAAVIDQVQDVMHTLTILTQFRRLCLQRRYAPRSEWTRSSFKTPELRQMRQ